MILILEKTLMNVTEILVSQEVGYKWVHTI